MNKSQQLFFYIFFICSTLSCQKNNVIQIDKHKIAKDLTHMIDEINENYVYLESKNVDLECLKTSYYNQLDSIHTRSDVVLFFEYLLNEFHDSHLILNTNTQESYRLFSPVYVQIKDDNAVISQVWISQLYPLKDNILDAEVIKYNNKSIEEVIQSFPTFCTPDKTSQQKEWILNKAFAGKRNEPRVLTLRKADGDLFDFDLDSVQIRRNESTLSHYKEDNIGIIRINNSLGDNDLVSAFNDVLDQYMDTDGLILDLRNTVDGGNTSIAKPIIGRFIQKKKAYQKYENKSKTWSDFAKPVGNTYKKPLVILVGRWTGSMGEGVAIGLEGMGRATVVGTEMERLAGGMEGFSFLHQPFQFRLSTIKVHHVNGTLRETYVPKKYVQQSLVSKDEILDKGIEMLVELIENS